MGIITKIIGMLDGWKSILGYLIVQAVALIVQQFPDAPQDALIVVLEWLGQILLAIGLGHKAVKEIRK